MWRHRLARWVHALVHRRQIERDLQAEIDAHLEAEAEELSRVDGLAPDEARRQALINFGGIERWREGHRDVRGTRLLDDARRDLALAVRSLRRNMGFATAVILSLGVGIGGVAVVFTWLERFAISPTPLVDERGLVRMVAAKPDGSESPVGLSYPAFVDWKRDARTVGTTIAFSPQAFGVRTTPTQIPAERVWGVFASANYFQALGVPLARGRFEDPLGDLPGVPPVAVISDRFWRSHFGGAAGVIGTTIDIDEHPVVIVGIAPRGFLGSEAVLAFDVWVNLGASPEFIAGLDPLANRRLHWLSIIARRRPDASMHAVKAEALAISQRVAASYPEEASLILRPVAMSADQGPRQLLTPLLVALLAAAVLLLAVVWANATGLFLARTTARSREIGIRRALGASRVQIVRHLLSEALVLASAALALAGAVAFYGHDVLLRLVPPLSISIDLGPWWSNPTGLLVATLGVLSVIVCALPPSVRVSRESTLTSLRDNERGGGRSTSRSRALLVVAQVAFATTAVMVAALFLRSLNAVRHVETGLVEPEAVVVAYTNLGFVGEQADNVATFLRRYLEVASSRPGVTSAAVSSELPLGFEAGEAQQVDAEGYAKQKADPLFTLVNRVSPGYLGTLGVKLVSGREFRNDDARGAADVAIINQAFVDRYFGGSSGLGRRVRVRSRWATVVGVAATAKYVSLTEQPRPFVYLPLLQWPAEELKLELRGTGGIERLGPVIRSVVREASPTLPLLDVQTLRVSTDASLFLQRFAASILGVLGGIAAMLAGLGLYAVIAYSVLRRRRETGIRVALGASPRRVLVLFLGGSGRVWGPGLGIGLLLAVGAARLIQNQLAGIHATDAMTLLSVTTFVMFLSIAASLIPSWRAARTDPVSALRLE
jgi:predicted permease